MEDQFGLYPRGAALATGIHPESCQIPSTGLVRAVAVGKQLYCTTERSLDGRKSVA